VSDDAQNNRPKSPLLKPQKANQAKKRKSGSSRGTKSKANIHRASGLQGRGYGATSSNRSLQGDSGSQVMQQVN
jgi:hypothetical protein